MIPFFSKMFGPDPAPAKRQVPSSRDARLRSALDGAPLGLAVSSIDGQWIWFNKTCCAVLGYSRDELLRVTLRDITHPDDAARESKMLRELMQGDVTRYRLRKRMMDKRGSYRTVHLSVSATRLTPNEPALLVYSIEAAAAPAAVEPAGESDRFSTLLLNQLEQAAVIRTDTSGIITGWNAGAAKLFGYGPEEMTGRNRATLWRNEDAPAAQLREAEEKGAAPSEQWCLRRDGSPLFVTSTLTRYAPNGATRGYVEVIAPAPEREQAATRAELERLRTELELERQKNASLTSMVRQLKTAETLHTRELRILAAAVRKEQAQRRTIEEQVATAAAAHMALPIRAAADTVQPVVEAAFVPAKSPEWLPLGERPLLELFGELESSARSGLLALANGEQHRGFLFSEGRIVSSASNDDASSLGARLVALQWIREAERDKALELSGTTGLPFGRALVVLGILDEQRIARVMREKILDDARAALAWRDVYWSFVEQPEPPAKLVNVSVGAAEITIAPPSLVASRNAGRYHVSTCPSAARIAAHLRITIATVDDAAGRGLTPCTRCIAPALVIVREEPRPTPLRATLPRRLRRSRTAAHA
ncbi:MAG TPA: PAS domain S-box protein [Thermoanaerobaculia bacterium]|jgi:PAS domain S-box-containing protein